MNKRAVWVLNGLLLAVVVLLTVLVAGGRQEARASGGGPYLDNWMATILDESEYLVLMKQTGDNIRIHAYQVGDRRYNTLLLKEVRETDADFALKFESLGQGFLQKIDKQNYFAVQREVMEKLKNRRRGNRCQGYT